MTRLKLIFSSIRHYRRAWLGVMAGSALTSMIITGAMLIGDSARLTLLNIAVERIGHTELALAPQDGFFSTDLDRRVQNELRTTTTSLLRLRGMAIATNAERSAQLNNIQVLGVQTDFWNFTDNYELPRGQVGINRRLADELELSVGDELAVRIEVPSRFARDAPLSSRGGELTRRRLLTIDAIVPDQHLGRFSLETNQRTPHTVFIDLESLQGIVDMPQQSNIMLIKTSPQRSIKVDDAAQALNAVWTIEDFGVSLIEYEQFGIAQAESAGVYLPPVIADGVDGVKATTYMVNRISSSDRSTPYSFMNAVEPNDDRRISPVRPEMGDDEIVVNRWVADTLELTPGDPVAIEYYSLRPDNELVVESANFRLFDIVEMAEIVHERDLVPNFPGLTDVDSCANWSIGVPLDEELLEDPDNEEYWEKYRATPKAFITYAKGRQLWGNRFGETTAVRIAIADVDKVRHGIENSVAAADLGYVFTPIRAHAFQAVDGAVDLGQLFLGMSFFLVLSSLLIIAFLFGLAIRQRITQCGLMLACGFRRRDVTTMLILEASIVAVLGAAVGCLAGLAYTRALLFGLAGGWRGAVAGAAIDFHFSIASPLYAVMATIVGAIVVMLLAARSQMALPAYSQLRADLSAPTPSKCKYRRLSGIVMWSSLSIALAVMAWAMLSGDMLRAAHQFFAAGFMLLLATLLFVRGRLHRHSRARSTFGIPALVLNNLKRRGNHSLGVVALLACGCFLVFSVSAMRENLELKAGERSSGTGGFDLFATTTIPLLDDLNDPESLREYRLEDAGIGRVLSIRVRAGDDSGCLNLNQAIMPTLLGVDTRYLSAVGAFLPASGETEPWNLLDLELDDGTIPAIAGDSDTLTWGLKMRAGVADGDVIEYRNSFGTLFKIRIVGSLPLRLTALHGNLLISKENFNRLFPSENGYRMFLVELAEGAASEDARGQLTAQLERFGVEIVPTIDRLRAFYEIESAYLSIFLLLGGFGMVLAAGGMGTIVWRNIAERKREIEILSAVGFKRRQIRLILSSEYVLLLLTGILCGTICALVAVAPSLIIPGSNVPWLGILLTMTTIALSGTAFIGAAVLLATRGTIAVPREGA